jgi:hypothetical protein
MYAIRYLRLDGFAAWHVWFTRDAASFDGWSHITSFPASHALADVIAWCGPKQVRLLPA